MYGGRTFRRPPDWLTLLQSSAESTFNFMFSEQNYPGTYFYRALALLIPALLAVYTIPQSGGAGRPRTAFGKESAVVNRNRLTAGLFCRCHVLPCAGDVRHVQRTAAPRPRYS